MPLPRCVSPKTKQPSFVNRSWSSESECVQFSAKTSLVRTTFMRLTAIKVQTFSFTMRSSTITHVHNHTRSQLVFARRQFLRFICRFCFFEVDSLQMRKSFEHGQKCAFGVV